MEKRKYSGRAIVALCTVAYFASYFSRKTFSVVMVNMLSVGAVDRDVAGMIGTALFIFYGAGQLVSGYLGDKLQPKYLMFSGLMVSAVCNLLLPLVPSQYLMIPVWAVNGFAQALLWPPIVRILSDSLSHEKYVTANLIVTCGAHVSTIILYVYAPLCIRYMSYKAVFFILQNLHYLRTGCFIGTKKELLTALSSQDKQVLETAIALSQGETFDFDTVFSLLLTWCKATMIHL